MSSNLVCPFCAAPPEVYDVTEPPTELEPHANCPNGCAGPMSLTRWNTRPSMLAGRGAAEAASSKAAEVVEQLLTNGSGERADRLVLWRDHDKRDLGGWGKQALENRLNELVHAAKAPLQAELQALQSAIAQMRQQELRRLQLEFGDGLWGVRLQLSTRELTLLPDSDWATRFLLMFVAAVNHKLGEMRATEICPLCGKAADGAPCGDWHVHVKALRSKAARSGPLCDHGQAMSVLGSLQSAKDCVAELERKLRALEWRHSHVLNAAREIVQAAAPSTLRMKSINGVYMLTPEYVDFLVEHVQKLRAALDESGVAEPLGEPQRAPDRKGERDG